MSQSPHNDLPPEWMRLENIIKIIHDSEPADPTPRLPQYDQEALDNEATFIRRFGCDWRREEREMMIRFKQETGYTDRQIKRLYRTGNLKCTANGVVELASKTKAWVGRIQLIWLNAVFLLPLFMNWQKIQNNQILALKTVEVLVSLVVFSWFTYQVYIKPWDLMNRQSMRR